MNRTGTATAPAAGTIINALATGTGAAFAIDEYVTAEVRLGGETVQGEITDAGNADPDTELIERCVERATAAFGDGEGGRVRTESTVPMAAGLKSSSAAANATVLATLAALGAEGVSRERAARVGVAAARDAGVTVTGAFDDASASMLGGVTLTDNATDALVCRTERSWDVLVWTPPERAYSANADRDRARRIAGPVATATELARDGAFARAMTVNGLAFCAALEYSTEPLIEAMDEAAGVSLSGTGPSVTAVGDREALEPVARRWRDRVGDTWLTTTQTTGAEIQP